jgi:hypothetical protein
MERKIWNGLALRRRFGVSVEEKVGRVLLCVRADIPALSGMSGILSACE